MITGGIFPAVKIVCTLSWTSLVRSAEKCAQVFELERESEIHVRGLIRRMEHFVKKRNINAGYLFIRYEELESGSSTGDVGFGRKLGF